MDVWETLESSYAAGRLLWRHPVSTEPEILNTLELLTYLNEMNVPFMLHSSSQSMGG